MANQRILVIGGTGYIGTPLVKKMISHNYDLTLLVKDKNSLRDELKKCKYFFGDLLDKESLRKNIDNFDLVINLAAVIRTFNKRKYQENVQGMKNLIEVLENKGIRRIIYFSTQSVNLKNKGPYSKSKEAAENLLKNSKLDYLIVRPNYVYGIDKRNDLYKLASFIYSWRITPVLGSGKYRIQPVLKDDLVDIVFNLIDNFKAKSIVEVSGNLTVSIEEIIKLIREELKIKPITIRIPSVFLQLFKPLFPFDIDGYTDDRISKSPFLDHNFSSFEDNLKEILKLLK